MAEMTLLEMTQDILSHLDSDEVNSISDTSESMQVAKIIKNKYYDIVARGLIPENKQLFQLDSSEEEDSPVLMHVPAGVSSIEWIKYFDSNPNNSQSQSQFGAYHHGVNTDIENTTTFTTTSTTSNTIGTGSQTFTVDADLDVFIGQGVICTSGTASMSGTITSYVSTTMVLDITATSGAGTFADWTITSSILDMVPGYKYVTMMPLDQFLDMINRFNINEVNVQSFTFTEGGNNFTFYYRDDIQPRYCTVIENNFIIFDSYDADFDTTLQSSKTLCFGEIVPPFTLTDSSVPDLDEQWFPLLLNEAKALAFFELKQTPHIKAEQEVKRQWSTVQKKGFASNKPTDFDRLANFGRVPRTGGYTSGGYGAYKWMRQAGP